MYNINSKCMFSISENNLEISQPKIMKMKEKGNLAFLMYQEVLFYNFILVSDNIEKKNP